jgi:hypothetical protein
MPLPVDLPDPDEFSPPPPEFPAPFTAFAVAVLLLAAMAVIAGAALFPLLRFWFGA